MPRDAACVACGAEFVVIGLVVGSGGAVIAWAAEQRTPSSGTPKSKEPSGPTT
jgi:hypothetical protein